jgi:EmrB/QacA subfamily drug resistance transporter
MLIAIVALAFSMIYPDAAILAVALPSIQKTYNITNQSLLWIINIYILMRAILVFASGQLSDIFTHRRTFIFGLVVFASASMGCAFASNASWLILFRAIQGIGSTLVFTSGMSLITSEVSAQRRGRAIGITLSVGLASMAAGPVISGIVIKYLSWHWIFLLNLIGGTIAMVLVMFVSKIEPKNNVHVKFDWAGFILSAIFTLFITLAFNNSSFESWNSAKFILTFTTAILALIFFLWFETKNRTPLIDLKLFILPNFSAGIIISSFVQVALLLIVFLGVFLQNALSYSALTAGFLLLPMVAMGVIFSNIGGYLVDKFGARTPVILGTGSILLGFVITLLVFNAISYYALLPLLIFSGIGMFMIMGPIRTAMLAHAHKDKTGMVNAALNGTRAIFSVIGFSIISAIITNVEFFQVKTQLLKYFPFVSTQQIQGLLGLLSHTSESQIILQKFSPQAQQFIHQIILTSYVNSFFWVLVFIGALMMINFFLAVFFIKSRKLICERYSLLEIEKHDDYRRIGNETN